MSATSRTFMALILKSYRRKVVSSQTERGMMNEDCSKARVEIFWLWLRGEKRAYLAHHHRTELSRAKAEQS